ncbi:hypothetical protein [Nocardia sp. CA-119907]|uniref:hypothetical protein n=1 Tax=Nocardia sp. CA-119907 TaxID=3239973 RepID=UPI003D96E5B2
MTPPSTAARLAQQAARMDATMTAAVAGPTSAVPAMTPESVVAALEAAVPIPVRGAAWFLEELSAHLATRMHSFPANHVVRQ